MKIKNPSSIIIETTALQLAATFYEVGRGQGLKSIHKDARAYARAMVTKFVPYAVDHLLDQLHNPHTPEDNKKLIFEALKERVNDKEILPDIDISKIIPTKPTPPVIINSPVPKELEDTISNGKTR